MSCFWQKTLYQVLSTHDKALKAVDEAFSLSSVTQSDGTVIVKVPRPNREQQALLLASKSRARKLALHQQVWDLHRQGYKAKTIVLCPLPYGVHRSLEIPSKTWFRCPSPKIKGRN
jgi:hypothetical protein